MLNTKSRCSLHTCDGRALQQSSYSKTSLGCSHITECSYQSYAFDTDLHSAHRSLQQWRHQNSLGIYEDATDSEEI